MNGSKRYLSRARELERSSKKDEGWNFLNSSNAVLTISVSGDMAGEVIASNPAARQMFRVTGADLINTHFTRLICPVVDKVCAASFRETFVNNEADDVLNQLRQFALSPAEPVPTVESIISGSDAVAVPITVSGVTGESVSVEQPVSKASNMGLNLKKSPSWAWSGGAKSASGRHHAASGPVTGPGKGGMAKLSRTTSSSLLMSTLESRAAPSQVALAGSVGATQPAEAAAAMNLREPTAVFCVDGFRNLMKADMLLKDAPAEEEDSMVVMAMLKPRVPKLMGRELPCVQVLFDADKGTILSSSSQANVIFGVHVLDADMDVNIEAWLPDADELDDDVTTTVEHQAPDGAVYDLKIVQETHFLGTATLAYLQVFYARQTDAGLARAATATFPAGKLGEADSDHAARQAVGAGQRPLNSILSRSGGDDGDRVGGGRRHGQRRGSIGSNKSLRSTGSRRSRSGSTHARKSATFSASVMRAHGGLRDGAEDGAVTDDDDDNATDGRANGEHRDGTGAAAASSGGGAAVGGSSSSNDSEEARGRNGLAAMSAAHPHSAVRTEVSLGSFDADAKDGTGDQGIGDWDNGLGSPRHVDSNLATDDEGRASGDDADPAECDKDRKVVGCGPRGGLSVVEVYLQDQKNVRENANLTTAAAASEKGGTGAGANSGRDIEVDVEMENVSNHFHGFRQDSLADSDDVSQSGSHGFGDQGWRGASGRRNSRGHGSQRSSDTSTRENMNRIRRSIVDKAKRTRVITKRFHIITVLAVMVMAAMALALYLSFKQRLTYYGIQEDAINIAGLR